MYTQYVCDEIIETFSFFHKCRCYAHILYTVVIIHDISGNFEFIFMSLRVKRDSNKIYSISMSVYLFIYIYKIIYIFKRNDINAQCASVTASMKLHNTKMRLVGHYFCCTIS